MLSPGTKRTLRRILPYGLIWLLLGGVFLFVEWAATGSFSNVPETAIKVDPQILVFALLAVFMAGLWMGFLEVLYLEKWFANTRFIIRLLGKTLVYALFFFGLIWITYPIVASFEMNVSLFDRSVWEKYGQFLISTTHLSTLIQLTVSLQCSLFYAEISQFIGLGVLHHYFTGRYHRPVEEKRIFMFSDMKSSTTLAERLGHLTYFDMLKDYYRSFTDAIVKYEGEIYLYVGDEIILSWKWQGDERDMRCVDCFFAMREALGNRADYFEKQYGVIPTFKSGIHFGKVTTGEIGVLKKDIMFSGDVLNTTARIQGMCNSFGVDLILSENFLQKLPSETAYTGRFLGYSKLRGKEEKTGLYTLEP